tara:strand:- start:1888 stop:2229 length:342 start_codon:yes stop_codon:yes gene_type:complete
MSFEDNIKKWVQLDNQIKLYNDRIKSLREQKSEITESLFLQAQENDYENAVIQITDGKLKFSNTKVQAPLTFKYIEEILSSTVANPKAREEIIKRLKDSREVKYTQEIKRTTN